MKKYKLGEIAEIIGGVTYDKADLSASGIRILRGGNIQNGEVCLKEDDVFLPYFYKDDKNTVQVGDTILVASTGSVEVLGKAATTFSSLGDVQIGAFLRIIRPKENKYAAIISAYLQSTLFRKYIQKQAKGTSINNIRNEHLANFTLYIPFDNNLVLFSSFYCNLDRKITLNRSINHNLEAMAKQLYDYWFVQFDFPDENGKPYKSSGGKMVWNEKLKREIPEGWNDCVLGDYIGRITNGLNPRNNFVLGNGRNYYVTIRSLIGTTIDWDNCDRCDDEALAKINSRSQLQVGDIIFSAIGTIGRTYYIIEEPSNWSISETSFTLRAKENIPNDFFYGMLCSEEIQIKADKAAMGSTLRCLVMESLCSLQYIKIPETTMQSFSAKVSVLYKQIHRNNKEILSLTKQRDELLPLLMNGQASLNYDLSHD